MIRIGLTGSIGMGKSTTADFFREFGVPVFDADAAVKELYAKGGAAVGPVEKRFPGAATDGAIDRDRLTALLMKDKSGFADLEKIVHPLVGESEAAFLRQAEESGAPFVVLDIPLLLEKGAAGRVDVIVVVTAPLEVQRARVLARPGMSEEKFQTIRTRQVGEAEKRAAADYIIETDKGFEAARASVKAVVDDLKSRPERS